MNMQKFGNKYGSKIDPNKRIDPTRPTVAPYVPAVNKAAFIPHGGTAKPTHRYTGSSMIGIGTMHKSNAVPIFSQESAQDISKMRRG